MQQQNHSLNDLFDQPGLYSSDNVVENLIQEHGQISAQVKLYEAKF